MSLAEDIAGKVKGAPADTDEVGADLDAEMKPGDHGKRILAAISAKDPEALEVAIKDCVESVGY